ncbi:hypothetical protein C0081_16100 [Cohaesibacter celericrescens]|uniref:Uncharacterized protein n=2 Tax=Cohaesibacter celericrescens TaxID=2067669 RepID=A0A2N5XPF1_9HYPH|nr:hypothetical protein C0081_16100 [Cohaesibacter celericrescens]
MGRSQTLKKGERLAVSLKIGSWLCAFFVIFSALVWLIGGFLVSSAISNNAATVSGLELIPQIFWPVRAIVSALGVVGAIILVLSRPSFFRVLSVWFASELALVAWLYATGFLVSQFDSLDSVRNLVILQICGFCVVLFAWVKHNVLYRS